MSGPQGHAGGRGGGPPAGGSAASEGMHTAGQEGGHPPYSLPGVLHYLQMEWRRFERERNEWEIEKSDLKAKIAFLEGERRGTENLRTDLMRRVKMLEYALRQERTKFTKLQQEKRSSVTASDDATAASQNNAAASTATVSEPPAALPENVLAASANYGTLNLGGGLGTSLNYTKGFGHARSKEILKNYLKEMGFLMTTGGGPGSETKSDDVGDDISIDSPLMGRPPGRGGEQGTAGAPNETGAQRSVTIGRKATAKMLPTKENHLSVHQEPPAEKRSPPKAAPSLEPSIDLSSRTSDTKQSDNHTESRPQKEVVRAEPTAGPKSKHEKRENGKLPQGSRKPTVLDDGRLTADEMHELKLTPEKVNKVMSRIEGKPANKKKNNEVASSTQIPSVVGNAIGFENDGLASLALNDEDTNEGSKKGGKKQLGNQRIWRPKVLLRNHLDSIRAVAFSTQDNAFVTASEDGTAKIWNLSRLDERSRASAEIEPLHTLRGHTEPLTSLALSADGSTCFTGSVDATIRAWRIPPPSRDPYGSYHEANQYKLHTYVGHSDVIWDLKLHPLPQQSPWLASVSGDGALKLWNTTPDEWGLRTTLWYNGASHGGAINEPGGTTEGQNPTSVDWIYTNLNRLAVSYQNSMVKIFDPETGQEVLRCKSDESYDGTVRSQINKVVAHPLLPLLVTCHEDRYVRIFDTNTGQCIHSMIAHQDSVSTADISSDGLVLATGGHDCSLRWWDLSTRKCVQEYTSHRKKNDEGIWAVKFHPEQTHQMATGGADAVVKVYAFEMGGAGS
ncbi:WD40-repeat-containing domain protein [Fimicolochytrium jonesii]|uniref:WD40-repeat-containing domain protein n=1 Tax=Fimicolochytrium jonesii TaxID=1396493 RepID=UPI0022FDD982|nr:WD40-repeat-containing domain protein [Fimicolochytrium jonesii]KAI8826550.1 WD40-repeat-containing domain protein [Fimicolochytrium jonesii]